MDVRALNLDDFAEWAKQLGVDLDDVRDSIGQSASRATKMRMKKRDGATRARAELLQALKQIERARPAPLRTRIGAAVLGFEEWCDLGAELARLDQDLFDVAIVRTRAVVAGRRAEAELEELARRKG